MGYPDVVLADAPALYCRMDDTSGTTLTDVSGSARHMTLSGTYTLNEPGLLSGSPAVSFSSGEASVAHGAWMNSASITVEAWIKTTSTGVRAIVDRDPGGSTEDRTWQFRLNAGKLEFLRLKTAAGGLSVVTAASPATVNNGAWRHVAATFDGTSIRLYVDGALVTTTAAATGLLQGTRGDARIKIARNASITAPFVGAIDEVAYYTTALSDARIAAHYAAGTGVTPPSAQSIPLGRATEIDSARALTKVQGPPPAQIISVGRATEAETARAITPVHTSGPPAQAVALARVTETDTPRALTSIVGSYSASLNRVVETNLARTVTPAQAAPTITARYLLSRVSYGSTVPATSGWTDGSTITNHLLTAAETATGTTTTWTYGVAGWSPGMTRRAMSYVSAPLTAGVLAGTFRMAHGLRESAADDDAFLTVKVSVLAADGSTIRGVLLPLTQRPGELTTTSLVRTFGPVDLSTVVVQDGDRLLLELGIQTGPSSVTPSVNARSSASQADVDFPFTDGAALSTGYRPWVEFEWQGDASGPPPQAVSVGRATEVDTAYPITPRVRYTLGRAVETNLALPMALGTSKPPLGRAVETDEARPIRPSVRLPLGRAVETNIARVLAPEIRLPYAQTYDNVANAVEIGADYGSEYLTLVNGTVEEGEVVPPGTVASSWVRFTADETTLINFTSNANQESTPYTLTAYEGSPLEEAGSVSGSGQLALTIDITEGLTYWLRVSSTTDQLDFQLVWNVDAAIVEPAEDWEYLRAEVYQPDGLTLITEVPKRSGVTFQEPLNVVGSGEMSVKMDAEVLDQYPDLLAFDNIVKFWIGTRCIHGFRIDARNTTWVSTDEWSGLVRKVSGPSVHHLMEDFMVRHPIDKLLDRASDQRSFSWVAPRGEWYNEDDWEGPYNSWSQTDPPSDFDKEPKDRAKYNNPKGFPDKNAEWMWVHWDPDRNDDGFNPPDLRGRRYFRKQFTTTDNYQLVKMYASADEVFHVYLDGEEVLSGSGEETGYTEMQKRKLVLKSGVHTLAIVQASLDQAKTDGADALLFSLMRIDSKGKPTSVIVHSDDSWETTYERPVPAWNRAQVLREVIKEAKDRGNTSAERLTLDFTGTQDSDNKAWLDRFAEDVAIGTSTLALQAMLSENGHFDVWVDPKDMSVKAWRRRGQDKSKSITLEPGRNLVDWSVDEVAAPKNDFLIQYDGGWTTWKADPSIKRYGEREAFVSMGRAKDDQSAQRILSKASRGIAWAEVRAGTSDIVKRKVGTPEGGLISVNGARPFLDFGVGDTIKAPNANGVLKPHRVLALTLIEDDQGRLSYDPELEEVR